MYGWMGGCTPRCSQMDDRVSFMFKIQDFISLCPEVMNIPTPETGTFQISPISQNSDFIEKIRNYFDENSTFFWNPHTNNTA
jgi:hypothetical protein